MSTVPSNEFELWHVTHVPAGHLDSGMASIVEMVIDPEHGYTQPIRARIDGDGYLREIREGRVDRYLAMENVRLQEVGQ